MLLQILIALLAGIVCGTFTGLSPGIHINLMSVLLLSSTPFLSQYFPLISLAVFIIAMGTTHTFIDPITSIYLGAPDSSDTALSILPGHRYLLKGHGHAAVKLTLIGSLGALVMSIILFPLLMPIVKHGYPFIEKYMGYLLLLVAGFMILRDKNKLWALIVFSMSGVLGLIVLSMPNLKDPLFPMLSGLFGISTLLISLNGKECLPEQKADSETPLDKKRTIKALISGQASGFLTAVFPGLGAATAAVLSLQFTKNLGDHGFLILMGAISTVNFSLSLLALLVLDKARNGAVIVVQQMLGSVTLTHILIFLAASLIAGGIAFVLGVVISKGFSKLITKVNYKALAIGVIALITGLIIFFSGALGFLVLIASLGVGLISPVKSIPRVHSMGCLLVPVIVYFLV
ncbi:tripartite tricarboxylate transporter permease [Candidatus Woesearchaeota archaeon]|nr:tripartite tricarboxylate transporter permease [Candidatus Woesearchaeota archaeon]